MSLIEKNIDAPIAQAMPIRLVRAVDWSVIRRSEKGVGWSVARWLRQVCPVCDKLRDSGLEGFANFGLEHVEKPGAVGFAERFAAALTKRVGGAQIGH